MISSIVWPLPIFQFIFYYFVQVVFVLQYPSGYFSRLNPPAILFFLHTENYPVAPFVADIHTKCFLRTFYFSEIEFPETAFSFYQPGKLYHPHKSDRHRLNFVLYVYQFLCYTWIFVQEKLFTKLINDKPDS